MKFRYVKLFFIIFVVILIIIAIHKITINIKNKNIENNIEQIKKIEYKEKLKIGISNFDNINPYTTQNREIINLNKLIFESLITLDDKYKIELSLATEYAKLSDKSYIIKIDTQKQWENGNNLSAEDVKYTIDIIKNSNSIYLENVEKILDVEIITNDTLKINLTEEVPFFEYNLIFPIICKNHYIDEDYFTSSKIPIGTGKYKIESINENNITLKAKSKEERHQDIEIYLYKETGDIFNDFKKGNVNFINTNILNYSDYIGTIGYYIKEYKNREVDFLSINCKDNILNDKHVRNAISYSIDKTKIISEIYNNTYYISENILDFGIFLYPEISKDSSYNPEQAKKLLNDSGWKYLNNRWVKNGKTLKLTITVNNSNKKRYDVAELIKQQLNEIGIDITIRSVTDSQYNSYLKNKNYQIILTGVLNGLNPDVSYFYGKDNLAQYYNEEVEEIINDTKNISDNNLLAEKYKRLNEIIKLEVPYISLYRGKNTVIINEDIVIQNIPTNFNIFFNL